MSRRRAAGQSAVAREEASPAGPETLGSRPRTSGTVRGARRLVRPLAFSSEKGVNSPRLGCGTAARAAVAAVGRDEHCQNRALTRCTKAAACTQCNVALAARGQQNTSQTPA